MARILIPLPDKDFDVTEVSVPWRLLTNAGHEVFFATENGNEKPVADPLLLTGVIFGQLGAETEAQAYYHEMIDDEKYSLPLPWNHLNTCDFDALILPGGHAQGMKQYLGSASLQKFVASFWHTGKPVGAICHGVIVLARSKRDDGRSVLYGKKTTCLPKYMERLAYYLTFWKLGKYYRTYPAYVEEEVVDTLANKADFKRGPINFGSRGTSNDHNMAYVVEDGNYVSARWPGDAYLFTERFMARL
jgi:putative intracellular protease/amidase